MNSPGLKHRLAALPMVMLDAVGLAPRPRVPVKYVVERANWSVRWDGTYICDVIDRLSPGLAAITDQPAILTKSVVHFGSHFQWLNWCGALAGSNSFVVTFFHGKPEDGQDMARTIDAFLQSVGSLRKVVTAAALVEQRLLSWGVPRTKLVRIPIGVDLAHFQPASAERREAVRRRYGIHPEQICIGSFQKDGVGWGAGDEPKLIKGPDIFVEAVGRVARHHPVFVLLTGPARGYVKRGLERLGIPYAHEHLEDYKALADRYAALDLYVNPSREEGGPKGILEGMAAGIPVVSTRVGMAPDVMIDRVNGFLVETGSAEILAEGILAAASLSQAERQAICAAARQAIAACDWQIVGRQHLEQVYQPLLSETTA